MVNKEQFISGILSYVDNEIIPYLPTAGKWGIGTVILLATSKYDELYAAIMSNEIMKALGVVDDNGLINLTLLMSALKKSADKYGKLVLSIPVIGTVSFTSDDVDKIGAYIEGGI